jgi:hypothetical protein
LLGVAVNVMHPALFRGAEAAPGRFPPDNDAHPRTYFA